MPFIHLFVCSFTLSLVRWFVGSLVRSFVRSFMHQFVNGKVCPQCGFVNKNRIFSGSFLF